MDPLTYKIKRFRRLESGKIKELKPIRKEICSDPIGNHIILLRRYIRQVNESLAKAKRKHTKKNLPDMPIPEYPKNFPFTETLLRNRNLPQFRMRFSSPIPKAFVEQQQIASILKILAQTGYYGFHIFLDWIQCSGCQEWAHKACSNAEEEEVTFLCDFCSAIGLNKRSSFPFLEDSKVIEEKQPKNKENDLKVKGVSSVDSFSVSKSKQIQKSNSKDKKNIHSENKDALQENFMHVDSNTEVNECAKSKNKRSNTKKSEIEGLKNKKFRTTESKNEKLRTEESKNEKLNTEGSKNEKLTDKVSKINKDIENKDKRKVILVENTENLRECEEDLINKKSDEADKVNVNKEITNVDSEQESTEREETVNENNISKDEEDAPVKVLSNLLTEFIKNFVSLMQRVKLSEPYTKDNYLWDALETSLQRISFEGIQGLYEYYYQEVYIKHEKLLKLCENLQKTYVDYKEKLKK